MKANERGCECWFRCMNRACRHRIVKQRYFDEEDWLTDKPQTYFEPQIPRWILDDNIEKLIEQDTREYDFIECPKCGTHNWIRLLGYYNPPGLIRIPSFRDRSAKELVANFLWWEFKRRSPYYQQEYEENIISMLSEFKPDLSPDEHERVMDKFDGGLKRLANKYGLAFAAMPMWTYDSDWRLLQMNPQKGLVCMSPPPEQLKQIDNRQRTPLKEWLRYLMIWEIEQRYPNLTWEEKAKYIGEGLPDIKNIRSQYQYDRPTEKAITNAKEGYRQAHKLVMGKYPPPREKSTSGYLRGSYVDAATPQEAARKTDWLALVAPDEGYKATKRSEHRQDEAKVYNDKLIGAEIDSLLKLGWKPDKICRGLEITREKYKKCRKLRVAHEPLSIAPTQPPSGTLPDKRDHPEIQLSQFPLSGRDRPFAEFWRVRRKLFPITQGINTYHLTNKFPDRQDKSAGCRRCAEGFSSYAIFLHMKKRTNLYLIDFLNPRYINKGVPKNIVGLDDEQGETTHFTQVKPS